MKKQQKSVFSGRFLSVSVQFQDIQSHEDEAEIHSDPGFSEVTEARVCVIVLELAEYSLRLQRPSFQFFLTGRFVQCQSGFLFLTEITESAAYRPVLIFLQLTFVCERASGAVVATEVRGVASESTSGVGYFCAYHYHEMSRRTDQRVAVGGKPESGFIILVLFHRTTGRLRIIVGIFDNCLDISVSPT